MGAARRSREACRLTGKAMARRRGRVGLGLALHTPRHSPVTPEACGHAGKETSPQAERLEPQEWGWADRVGGGAPNTRTSSGREGAAWGDGSVLVGPLPGTGEEHAQGEAHRPPTAWRARARLGGSRPRETRRPGADGAAATWKGLPPRGGRSASLPPPAPQNEVLCAPGHLAALSTPTPAPPQLRP